MTKSANDAAAALGELLGGSEDRFAQMMTLRARALGMAHTTFTNASGLPDDRQWTTARDLAVLARQLVTDFPDDYHYFSTPSFVFQRRIIYNHDGMLRTYPGADGMKTGYTEASGHNLVTSAVRDGVRLIGVVLGAASNAARDVHMAALLNQGFARDGRADRRAGDAGGEPRPSSDRHRARRDAGRGARRTRRHGNRGAQRAAGRQRRRPRLGHPGRRYATEHVAQEVAASAHRAAETGEVRIEHVNVRGVPLWRAQVVGLTAARAQGACAALAHSRTPCVVLRPEPGQIASR